MGLSLTTNPSRDKIPLAYFPKSIQMICVCQHNRLTMYESFLAYQNLGMQVLLLCMDYLLE
jgi:hypothetical protein